MQNLQCELAVFGEFTLWTSQKQKNARNILARVPALAARIESDLPDKIASSHVPSALGLYKSLVDALNPCRKCAEVANVVAIKALIANRFLISKFIRSI